MTVHVDRAPGAVCTHNVNWSLVGRFLHNGGRWDETTPVFCSPLTGFTLVEYQGIAGDVIEQTIISASYHAIDPHVRGDSGTPPDQEERWGCP